MIVPITYIFRKADPNFKSIEALFGNLSRVIGENYPVSICNLKFSGGSPKALWLNFTSFKAQNQTIYHITGDVHYIALVTGSKTVLTVHDVNSIVKGGFLKRCYMKLFWFWLPALCVKHITVISEFTKRELEKIIPFAKHKITVVNNPVNKVFEFSDYEFNAAKPRILLLGSKPNKNLNRVLESFKGIPCKIVLIGQPSAAQERLVEELNLDFTYKYNLELDEVVAEYKASDILCFASTYEGFGMPIIEAQAVGRPVITSNIGAMKEVAADSAFLVNPYNVESIRHGVLEVIQNSALREGLIARGLQNVTRFSAENVAEKYVNIYRELSVD